MIGWSRLLDLWSNTCHHVRKQYVRWPPTLLPSIPITGKTLSGNEGCDEKDASTGGIRWTALKSLRPDEVRDRPMRAYGSLPMED